VFFFEKKNQKTFASLGVSWGVVRDSARRNFLRLFSKKEVFS
jgi:hypothetical protein